MKTSSTICFNLRKSWQSIARMYNIYGAEHKVSVSAAYVLLNLKEDEGVLSTQIGPMLSMEASSMTRMLKSLEEKGLIYKKQDPVDARQMHVFLTKEGVLKKEIARKTVLGFNNKIRDTLTPKEIAIFIQTLEKINQVTEQNYPVK